MVSAAEQRTATREGRAEVAVAVAAGAVGAIYMISETNAQAKALPIYKRDEIAKHNTEESLWVHYEGWF